MESWTFRKHLEKEERLKMKESQNEISVFMSDSAYLGCLQRKLFLFCTGYFRHGLCEREIPLVMKIPLESESLLLSTACAS